MLKLTNEEFALIFSLLACEKSKNKDNLEKAAKEYKPYIRNQIKICDSLLQKFCDYKTETD